MQKSTITPVHWGILFMLCFIWGNSLLPASASSAISEFVREVANVLLDSVADDGVEAGSGLIRKIAHATEFAVLGGLIMASLSFQMKEEWKSFLLSGFIVAFFDESIQLFSQGRAAQVTDMWIDLVGYCVGGLMVMWVHHSYGKKKRKESRTQ